MRYRSNPVEAAEHERTEVTIDTPLGPIPVTWGKQGRYYGDRFEATYRGEQITADKIDPDPGGDANPHRSIRGRIAQIEAEYQDKRARDAYRRKAAKTPLPAHLVTRDSIEAIHVRGIDQRNGNALITRANGDKDQERPANVLRELNDSELADLIALQRAVSRAAAATKAAKPNSLDGILKARGVEVDLTIRLDPDHRTRVTEHNGREYRGSSARDLVRQVTRDLVKDEFPLVEVGRFEERRVVPIDSTGDFWGSSEVYRSMDEVAHYQVMVEREKHARRAFSEACVELAFDFSLFAEPAPEKPDDEARVDPNVTAPATAGEW